MTEALAAAASATAVELYKDARNVISSIDGVIEYEKNLDKNCETLKEEAKKLLARRDDVLTKINRDKTKQATKECEVWIGKVDKIEKEVLALLSKYDEERMHQLRFQLDCFWPHSNLSKCMVEKHGEVQNCWAEGSTFATEVVIERPPEPVVKVKAPKIDDKPSLQGVVEEIMEHLRDKDIKRIGLWGMVGVGKTAIMQNLNNNEQIAKMFEIVIFVTLAEQGNEENLHCSKANLKRAQEKLQQEIARRLKLNIEGSTNSETIASRISMDLTGKRYLVLLDDVWDMINLDDIGIHDNEEDSKVVLASRHHDICLDMDADEIINVKPLSKADAQKLFLEKLGRNISHSDFDPLVPLILRECSNLPLVIVKVARTFRKKDKIRLWHVGLKNLKKWPDVKFQGMDEVLERLRFCYEELDEEEKKICFLYGALYPHGYEIYMDYLLECWRAEGFICDVEDFSAREKGLDMLNDLINVSLLENGEKLKHVKMNKVIRSMALKISSEKNDSKYLVRVSEDLQQLPNEEEWREAKRISLIDNKLCALPIRPDCNSLSTLLLQRNDDLAMIPELFFKSMRSLRVLNLQGTSISALPSMSCLESLRALYLNSCNKLMELPSEIAALAHLEVLDIQGTGINFLPSEIGCLRRLRCLRMSLPKVNGESMHVDLSQNVISKLALLEELVIDVHPENQSWKEVVRAIAEEVATLTKLTSLSFYFPDLDSLEIILKSSMWEASCFTFQFSIGHCHSSSDIVLDYQEYEICRCLKYVNGVGTNHAVLGVLAETNAFELIGYKGSFKLSDFGIDNISKLKSCLIESCSEMETIVDGNGANKSVLECLEKMYISNATKLKSTWEGHVPAGSLAQLTTLNIFKCSMLKKIFSRGMIQQLSKLQHLEVQECHEVEEIVMESENNGSEPAELPSLRILILHDLPKLRSIWTDNLLKCPSLKSSKISECPLLKDLPSLYCYQLQV